MSERDGAEVFAVRYYLMHIESPVTEGVALAVYEDVAFARAEDIDNLDAGMVTGYEVVEFAMTADGTTFHRGEDIECESLAEACRAAAMVAEALAQCDGEDGNEAAQDRGFAYWSEWAETFAHLAHRT